MRTLPTNDFFEPKPDDANTESRTNDSTQAASKSSFFKPVLSLWALVLFGLAFVGPTAPYTFFGVGAVQSRGHFALVYLIALIAVEFYSSELRQNVGGISGIRFDLCIRLQSHSSGGRLSRRSRSSFSITF